MSAEGHANIRTANFKLVRIETTILYCVSFNSSQDQVLEFNHNPRIGSTVSIFLGVGFGSCIDCYKQVVDGPIRVLGGVLSQHHGQGMPSQIVAELDGKYRTSLRVDGSGRRGE